MKREIVEEMPNIPISYDANEQLILIFAITLFLTALIIVFVIITRYKNKKDSKINDENRLKINLAMQATQTFSWDYNVKDQCFKSTSPEVFKYSGIHFDELVKYTLPAYKEILIRAFNAILNGEQTELSIHIRIAFPDKQKRWFNMNGLVFDYDNKGKPNRIIGITRDISDLKIMEELIALRKKADEANELKRAFLQNISHEIRTPLNSIIGFSNLIIESEDKEEKEHFIKIIEKNNNLLLQLINDIVDLSQIETNQLEFSYSEVNLNKLLLHLQDTFSKQTKKELS